MEIKVRTNDYGNGHTTRTAEISHPDNRFTTTNLTVDFSNGEATGASFTFNGTRTCGCSLRTIEELRRIKKILNSFEEI